MSFLFKFAGIKVIERFDKVLDLNLQDERLIFV